MNLWQKTVTLLGFGQAMSTQNATDFERNTITVGAYQDWLDRSGGCSPLGISAAWACVNLLAGTIASLPLMVYRTNASGQRALAKDHPLYRVLHDSPNADQTALDFWEFVCASIELRGNAFAEIERGVRGQVVALQPIKPEDVKVRRIGDGSLSYEWSDGGRSQRRGQGEVFHVRGFGGNALGGLSTLSACAGTFGGASALEAAASSMFANGARPSGLLTTDKPMNKEQRSEAERLLQSKFTGALNSGRPMLLDNGVKWESLSINPDDAQMLESRRFSVEEICRIFGVPPHMIGHTENSTSWGTGLEQQTLGFQKFTLRRRLKRIEQAIEKQLLTADDIVAGVTIEFNLEGLLRGDSKSRAEFYRAALGDTQKPGWMVRNEIRRLENLEPIDGWDDPIPLISQLSPPDEAVGD